jgi:hypothetical protein
MESNGRMLVPQQQFLGSQQEVNWGEVHQGVAHKH